MERQDTRALEALLFVSDEPMTGRGARAGARGGPAHGRRPVRPTGRANSRSAARARSCATSPAVGGCSPHPDASAIVERFVLSSRQARLTKAALETLAIVAYKQPVTRHQVSAIRGVNSDGVLRALTDRGLIEEAGRDEGPGRPLLYAHDARQFLERLGLPSLAALPSLAPLLDASLAAATPPTAADRARRAGCEPDVSKLPPDGRQTPTTAGRRAEG